MRKTRQRKSHPVAPMAAHLAPSHFCRDIIFFKKKKKGMLRSYFVVVADVGWNGSFKWLLKTENVLPK